jgi:hypothetical protein
MRRSVYFSLLIAVVAAFVALVAPAVSTAANGEPCPAGYKGTVQPYCEKEAPKEETKPKEEPKPTPPPPFTTVAVGNEVVSGAVKVTLSVPGAGTLTFKGNAIKGFKVTTTAAGNIVVTLKATGKVLQHLENKGWTRKKQIYATFTAANGTTQTVKIVVRFRKP